MIELLLVLAIMLLTSVLALPSIVRSLRGARLRSSARTVVMVHRYTRSMAVLQQKQFSVFYDTGKNEIEVVALSNKSGDERSKFLDERSQRDFSKPPTEEASPVGPEEGTPVSSTSEFIRKLADGVSIQDFNVTPEDQQVKGVYWVNYYPSGSADKFSLALEDERHNRLEIEADPLSGRVKVEKR